MNGQTTRLFYLLMASALLAKPALAGFESGSDGTDGVLDCAALITIDPETDCVQPCDQACTVEINLSLAEEGPWDSTPHAAGVGVYDRVQWAVVYHYTTIDIPPGVTVTFKNHSSGAPVFWLATGGATIDGTAWLKGANGSSPNSPPSFAVPGPGGFHGGRRTLASGLARTPGFGPGGSRRANAAGAGHALVGGGGNGGPQYGSSAIIPLIGGSGGSARLSTTGGGGAGGGAILIASNQSIEVSGAITAIGGNGSGSNGGSGGAIRLVAADTISGTGQLLAIGGIGSPSGDGSVGRIRLEALIINFLQSASDPDYWGGAPSAVFPDFADTAPTLEATFVDTVPITDDPDAGQLTTDVVIDNLDVVTLEIEASNIPADTETVEVEVRIVSTTTGVSVCLFRGGDGEQPCETCVLVGTFASSSCSVEVLLPPGRNEIQLKACWPDLCNSN